MPYPPSNFPVRIWDGLSDNPDRIDGESIVNPDALDWMQAVAEIIAMQIKTGGTILPTVTESGLLVIFDEELNSNPLTTSAIVFVDATSGAITINLPAASTMDEQRLNIKKIDSSVNAVTIDADGAETIDGELTRLLTDQYANITIISDGSEWFIL